MSPPSSTHQGYQEDDVSDLLFPGGRPLDTKLGRFHRSDPFSSAPWLAEGWNRYSYALNDPLNLSDPTGLASGSGSQDVDSDTTPQEVYDKLPGVGDWTELAWSIIMGQLEGTDVSKGVFVNLADGSRFEATIGADGKLSAYILSAAGSSPDEGQSTGSGGTGADGPPPPGVALTPGSGMKDPLGAGLRGFIDGFSSGIVARLAFAAAAAIFSPAIMVAGTVGLAAYGAYQFIESGGVQQMRSIGERMMAGTVTDQDLEKMGQAIGGFASGRVPSPNAAIAGAAAKAAGGGRAGKGFTRKGKQEVIERNKAANEGRTVCENCGVETVPAQKSQRGVTPAGNETQVDHVYPSSRGGSGTPDNGQLLCRGCNRAKSDQVPE